MLKKGLLLMYTCVLVFLLCGCGNPLEELPEATGENIYNTEEEVDHILTVVPEVVQYLRNMSPVWRDLQTGKRQYIL